MTDPDRGRRGNEGEPDAEELYEEMTEGRDETTSRESFERALIEQGRSEEGQDVGDHIE